jgi:O-Antigen ligase
MSLAQSARSGRFGRSIATPVAGTGSRVVAGLLGFFAVAPAAMIDGGYFATAWGWNALMLLTVAILALVLRHEIRLQLWEVVALASATAFLCWIFASSLWAPSATQPVLEGERMLVYVGGLVAMLLVVRVTSYRAFLGGALVAIVLASCYGLATRIFPGWHATFSPIGGYRLADPIGYWNGLGIFAAIGVVLALGFAARARAWLARALGGAAAPLLGTTLYFTYSRGAWLALGLGLAAAVIIDSRRVQLVVSWIAVFAWAVAAIALASRSPALTHQSATRAAATHDGHRLALELVALALGAGASAMVLAYGERRVRLSHRAHLALGAVLLVVFVAALGGTTAHYGGPSKLAHKAYRSIGATEPQTGNLNSRLFSLSSNGRTEHWHVAWIEYRRHPWLGSGAGTFEQYWMRYRNTSGNVRNAHNLYLETLATLGPFGLAFLVLMLSAPLVAAIRARRRSLTAAACGAYGAFLAHAAVDWDWQLPAVTLAALACASALLVAARNSLEPRRLSAHARLPALAVSLAFVAFAFVGLMANLALSRAHAAIGASSFAKAEADARTAHRWAPWSSQPWQALGEAQALQRHWAPSRASFRQAIADDPQNWYLWFELGGSSAGTARRKAIAQALRLNPLSAEIAQTVPALRRRILKGGGGAR